MGSIYKSNLKSNEFCITKQMYNHMKGFGSHIRYRHWKVVETVLGNRKAEQLQNFQIMNNARSPWLIWISHAIVWLLVLPLGQSVDYIFFNRIKVSAYIAHKALLIDHRIPCMIYNHRRIYARPGLLDSKIILS